MRNDEEFMDVFMQLDEEQQTDMLAVMEVMTTPQMKIYFPGDGTAVIRWPEGFIPDMATVERASKLLNEYAAHQKHTAQ